MPEPRRALPIDRSDGGRSSATTEPAWARWLLISIAVAFLSLLLIAPLAIVFAQALEEGWSVYVASLVDPDALAALRLTLVAALVTLVLNTLFGLAAAWAIGKFRFRGRSLLITIIDLPFAVSPVIAGLIFVLLFGLEGWLGPWLSSHGIRVIFAVPGIVLATLFVTLPFVARELIPVFESRGTADEEVACVMGASGRQIFLW
ncbi:MAG TPA: sulfate/thiosulfate ABC transporter permease CysW, partial [Planctomycetota bacterium]|nr:sulfate/thiosulfate ABC transporter permease CysW [Planctomycetota bacterium]